MVGLTEQMRGEVTIISSHLQAEMGGVRVNSPHEFRNHQEFISAAHLASSQIREITLRYCQGRSHSEHGGSG